MFLLFFLKKFLFGANGSFLAQKWQILITPHNCPDRIFLKFCIVEGANGEWKLYEWFFQNKIILGRRVYGLRMVWLHNSGYTLSFFYLFFFVFFFFFFFFWFTTVKGAKKYMRLTLKLFPKNAWFKFNGPFLTQNHTVSAKLWIHSKFFTLKRATGHMKICPKW